MRQIKFNILVSPRNQASLILCFALFFTAGNALCRSAEDEKIFQLLKNKLDGKGDIVLRDIHRSKNREKSIELEAWISRASDYQATSVILSHPSHYRDWALKGINDRPGGGKYRIQFLDFKTEKSKPNELLVLFGLDIPMYPYTGDRLVKLDFNKQPDVFTLKASLDPDPTRIIQDLNGTIKIFPIKGKQNRCWMHLKGYVTIGPWILYEALPDRMLNREITNRLELILANYFEAEDKWFEGKLLATSSE